MLCLTLDAHTIKEDKAILKRNRRYISIAELRADMLEPSESEEALDFPEDVDVPVILTVRRTCDGGRFKGSEEDRKVVLWRLSRAPFSYVDMEVDLDFPELEQDLAGRGIPIIRSLHDFKGIPDDLPELARSISSCGQIPKLAVTVNSEEALEEVFHLGEIIPDVPERIIVGMGRFGIQTRINYRRLGSMLTFCSEKDPNGIGLPSPKELSDIIDKSL